jgi:thiol-disulfide isomerase/thioredoxin
MMLANLFLKKAVSVRIPTMVALEEFLEKHTDKIVLLLFWAKWFPDCEALKKRMEEIQPNMMHMIITWCDVSIDKDVVLFFKI